MLKQLCCSIFFRIFWWTKFKGKTFIWNRNLCNIINVFAVPFDQFNASLLKKSVNLFITKKYWLQSFEQQRMCTKWFKAIVFNNLWISWWLTDSKAARSFGADLSSPLLNGVQCCVCEDRSLLASLNIVGRWSSSFSCKKQTWQESDLALRPSLNKV